MRTRASPLAGAHFHGYACAGLSRIALIVDAPAALLQRHDALGGRLVPAVLARRGEPEHPVAQTSGRHGRAEPRFQLVPGMQSDSSVRPSPVSSFKSGFAGSPRSCRRTLPTPTGPRICRSVRSPRCCQSKEPEPPCLGAGHTETAARLPAYRAARDRLGRRAWLLGRSRAARAERQQLTRREEEIAAAWQWPDQFSFCRRCLSSSLSG